MTATMQRFGTTSMDDQMVPDISFDVVTVDGGATVFETVPSETTDDICSKPLPDFDSLLQELNSTGPATGSTGTTSITLMDIHGEAGARSWENTFDAYTEISMYEDTPYLEALKSEKPVDIKQEPADSDSSCSSSPALFSLLPSVQEELGVSDIAEIADLKTKINYVCQTISIPSNPYCWSTEEAKRWLLWTLKSYNLPQYLAEQFMMAGSALSYLSQDDFRQRSPQAGEFLSTELDIWKTAHNLSLPEFSNQEENTAEFYQEEPPTFTDLDAVSLIPSRTMQQQQQQQQQTMKCIPTPVITCTSPYSPTSVSPMTSSLNPSLADSPHYTSPLNSSGSGSSMLSVSPSPSLESLSNTSSSGASWSYTIQNSPDMEENSTDMHQSSSSRAFQDVHTVPTVPHHGKHTIHLWQFLKELLLQPHCYQSCIRWLDRSKGIFKIEDSSRVAKLWGMRKNRPAMNYDKLSRSIRQYYKKGIIKKTTNSKRLVYQFCPQYL